MPRRAIRSARQIRGRKATNYSVLAEYKIGELAHAANTTVRNVRSYHDRRLLPAPEVRGRTGIYSAAHLARLRLIGQLLDRGYTLHSIGELIGAWERGHDIAQVLGLEMAITSPWSDEAPTYMTLTQLLRKFGGRIPAATVRKAQELGVFEREGMRVRVPSARMLNVGAELVAAGVPLDEMLDIVRLMRGNVERVALELVRLVMHHVFDPYGSELPPAADAPHLANLIWRLRPLADTAVNVEVARAMQKAVNQVFGDKLSYFMEHLHDPKS